MNMRGMKLEALIEVRDREKELADLAAASCKRLRLEIVAAEKRLGDLREALRVLSLRAGDHNDCRAMAQAYLDMRKTSHG